MHASTVKCLLDISAPISVNVECLFPPFCFLAIENIELQHFQMYSIVLYLLHGTKIYLGLPSVPIMVANEGLSYLNPMQVLRLQNSWC